MAYNTFYFQAIAKHRNVNIMLYKPKKDSAKDAGSVWRLFYDKIRYKSNLPKLNVELRSYNFFFYIEMGVLCRRWACKSLKQIFMWHENLRSHFKEGRHTREKTNLPVQDGGGDTKFSYTVCQ